MTLLELLNQDPKNLDNWARVIGEEVYFESLLREGEDSDWDSAETHLQQWFDKFESFHEQRRFAEEDAANSALHRIAINQWQHAAKLFVCARFAVDHVEAVKQIVGDNFNAFTSEFVADQGKRLSQLKNLDFTDGSHAFLCGLFDEKSNSEGTVFSQVRRIPFATASESEDEGRIHILEIARVRSHQMAIRNPRVFPHVDVYAESIADDFKKAIDLALVVNTHCWDRELVELQERIDELKKLSKHEVDASELRGLESDLRFRQGLGSIKPYGVVWDVKPHLTEKQRKEWRIYKESVRKALRDGKETGDIAKPRIELYYQTLLGESIGLAAYSGIYFTLRNKFPDQRGILSAHLVDNQQKSLEIKGVRSIPQKIRAAISINEDYRRNGPDEIQPFDGFGIHEDNWKDKKEREEILTAIEGREFQIIVLDSYGSVVEEVGEQDT